MAFFPNKKGDLLGKGITLVLFFLLIPLLAGIAGMVNFGMLQSINQTYGSGATNSGPYGIMEAGMNGTFSFARGIPMAATLGGIVLILLLLGFAVGGWLMKRRNEDAGNTGGSGGFNNMGGFA